jgi:hypothetical protein
MAIKKITPVKKSKVKPRAKVKAKVKTVKTPVKKVAAVKAPINFPARTFMVVSLIVFIATGLFLMWWGYLAANNSSSVDGNAWIYSRHKYDQYRAVNCGGDPLITMPDCPRGD